MADVQHVGATYNDIHNIIKASATKIAEFKPNMLIAIGGGLVCVLEDSDGRLPTDCCTEGSFRLVCFAHS